MSERVNEVHGEVLAAYDFKGKITNVSHYGEGHINDTFVVQVQKENDSEKRYIIQKINTGIFHKPAELMENICGVTQYLRKRIIENGGDPERETLNVYYTKEGTPFYVDGNEGVWRVYAFVENTDCLQKIEKPEDFVMVAETFGNFQNMLADYPAETLHETIKAFHDTPSRYVHFEKAVEEDRMGRVEECAAEIAFVRERKADCRVLSDYLKEGKLPLRVTHNDTKLNNLLIDKDSGKGICVIDLDTVMPGLSLYDFGDAVRFGANDCAEDEKDLNKVNFSLHLYEIFTKAYLAVAGNALTDLEKDCLPWGAKTMTLECGIRFLTDYLEGDTYFKIHRDKQNLDRCRTQFKLVQDMERDWSKLQEIGNRYR